MICNEHSLFVISVFDFFCIISETFKLVFDYSQFIGNKFDRPANM